MLRQMKRRADGRSEMRFGPKLNTSDHPYKRCRIDATTDPTVFLDKQSRQQPRVQLAAPVLSLCTKCEPIACQLHAQCEHPLCANCAPIPCHMCPGYAQISEMDESKLKTGEKHVNPLLTCIRPKMACFLAFFDFCWATTGQTGIKKD